MNREQKVALGLGLFAVIYMVGSWRLPRFSLGTTVVDSYIFPMALGVLLLLLSAVYFVTAGKKGKGADAKPLLDGVNLKVLLPLIAATFVYAFILEFLGFVIATTLFLMATMFLLGVRRWLKLFLTCAGFSVVVYSLFVFVLNVPLAQGLMPF